MAPELRGGFHRELDKLEISVGALLALIPDSIRTATEALLAGDETQVAQLGRSRVMIEELYGDVEHTAEVLVARQAPVAGDLRFVFACVRLVPHLHDAIELIGEVAAPARTSIGSELTGRLCDVVARIGEITAEAWAGVADLWDRRDLSSALAVIARDDEITELRGTLSALAASGTVGVAVAMELALLGRSYERLGRYALLAAQRIEPLIPVPRDPI
jgi:phosphate transport system protein